jgi:hypothetical protein
MRYALAIALVLSAWMVVPACAGDVPLSTLKSLGLGSLKQMSDAEGAKVRGMSSGTSAMGTSLVSGLLIDPATKSFIFGASADAAMSSSENAGWGTYSEAGAETSSAMELNLTIDTGSSYFTGTLYGGAGGSSASFAQ